VQNSAAASMKKLFEINKPEETKPEVKPDNSEREKLLLELEL
jgi:hypothetical protein